MDADVYEAAKERVLAEYYAQVNGRTSLSFKETIELRDYAKARTDLHSDDLTPDQVIWKKLHEGLTEELRKSSPDSMAEIEQLEKERDNLQGLQDMMAAKMAGSSTRLRRSGVVGIRYHRPFHRLDAVSGPRNDGDLWVGIMVCRVVVLHLCARQCRSAEQGGNFPVS